MKVLLHRALLVFWFVVLKFAKYSAKFFRALQKFAFNKFGYSLVRANYDTRDDDDEDKEPLSQAEEEELTRMLSDGEFLKADMQKIFKIIYDYDI